MEPNEERNIEVEIPKLKTGNHDLLLLAVRQPEFTLKENRYIPGDYIYITNRKTLIIDKEIEQVSETLNVNGKRTEELFPGLIVSNKPNDSIENSLSYINNYDNLWLTIPYSDEASEIAVIILINGNEINHKFRLIKPSVLGPGVVSVPLKEVLKKVNKDKRNELIAIAIENPFQPQENIMHKKNRYFTNKITFKR